jgi:hypothetical protein
MATYVQNAEYVAIDGTDLSAYVSSASLEITADNVEFTTFGSSGSREFKQGLKTATLNVQFFEDFANSATVTDQKLWGIFNTGANVTFELRPTNAAVGTTNPKYTGSVCPTGYGPFTGSVGEAGTVSISWPTSGAVSRATS